MLSARPAGPSHLPFLDEAEQGSAILRDAPSGFLVGLRMARRNQAVSDLALGACLIEGRLAAGFPVGPPPGM
jgi:hypothetical protein